MNSGEYKTVLDRALVSLGHLLRQRDEMDVEINKTKQFISATINMLSEEDRKTFDAEVIRLSADFDAKESSLSDTIRDLLYNNPKQWFTTAQVRDRLRSSSFDFSAYLSNPLASVSTTLKRLVPKEAETTTVDGVTAYRFRNTKEARLIAEQRKTKGIYATLFGNQIAESVTSPTTYRSLSVPLDELDNPTEENKTEE